jgi:tetratricopeptide (TPR) repeat protein
MLATLRQVLGIERDRTLKAELSDEIGDVLHRLGNLYATFARYDEAMECFTEVLETQRDTKEDELRIADLLFNMGHIHLEQGSPAKSFECLRESYDITKLALGEDNKELHSTMYLMGVAMTNLADYESALKWLSRALSVLRSRENNGDENAFDEAAQGKTLRQMGTVHERMGDHANALSCFQESVQILKAVQGEDLELSDALNSMGNLLRSVSEFERALDCYDQSLTIRIELGDQMKIANTKNNIGAVLSAIEELDRAMAFSAEALRIKTERLGCDSVETGRALVNVSCFNCYSHLFSV